MYLKNLFKTPFNICCTVMAFVGANVFRLFMLFLVCQDPKQHHNKDCTSVVIYVQKRISRAASVHFSPVARIKNKLYHRKQINPILMRG